MFVVPTIKKKMFGRAFHLLSTAAAAEVIYNIFPWQLIIFLPL